jgi:hypothetical protein
VSGHHAEGAGTGRTRAERLARAAGAALVVVAVAGGVTGPGAARTAVAQDSTDPEDGQGESTADRTDRQGEALSVVAQSFTVAPDQPFEITLELPPALDTGRFDAGAVLVVTSHRSIADRAEMHASIDGEHTRTEDTFDISLDPAAPDPNVLALGEGRVSVRIPTESQNRTAQALQLAQSGVHPIVLELRVDDRPAGQATTYVHRLPIVPTTSGPLSVAFVMREPSPPVLGSDGSMGLTTAARSELARLADVLAALDGAAAAAGVADVGPLPRGVLVEPSLLPLVAADDPGLATTLLPGLAGSRMLAAPRLPLDASAAVAADQQERYGTWLREGEDLLRSLLPNTSIDRDVVLVADRVSTAGAAMQRTLGARLLVLPWDFYTDLDGSLLELTDISQLVTIDLGDGTEMPAAIVDDHLGNQLVRGADDPFEIAIEIASELVVLARDLDVDGRAVDRHGVLLALPDMGVPDPALVAELGRLLVASPVLRLVDPGELATTTTTLLNDGRLVRLTLPDRAGPDLVPRLEVLATASDDVLAHASMLPPDAPDISRWTATLDAMSSTAMSDTQVAAAVDRLDADFATFRDAIVAPEPFSFTLTGTDSKLRFALGNTGDTPLTVRVRLSSPKIRFPDGDLLVELPADGETDVVVNAEALSNGKSSVFLRVYAPLPDRDVELRPEVVLTARVTSLAGLGQLLTGAGALLVITWWANHARRSRRTQQAARHATRHPAARGARDPVAAGREGDPTPVDEHTDVDEHSDDPGDECDDGHDVGGLDRDDRPRPVSAVEQEVSPDAAASSRPPG